MIYSRLLIMGLANALCLLGSQWLWWRLHLPRRQTRALCVLFAFITALLHIWLIRSDFLDSWVYHIHLFTFECAYFVAYVITYSAIEADSPTLIIIRAIASKKQWGLERSELSSLLGDDVLVYPRILDLLRDNLLMQLQERYTLTKKGRWFIGLFIWYRNLIKKPMGG